VKNVSLIVFPAADLATAKKFFRELIGTDPYVDSAQYIGYKSGATEIGIVPAANAQHSGALAYWDVDDIAASVASLLSNGGTIVQDVTNVGHGLLVASVQEPNGSTIGLRQTPRPQ
jgi:predicted enzyme related to lactoylglutathione lyase